MMHVPLYIFLAFIGFSIGRIGHIFWGHLNTPHHWIYGLILIVLGGIYYSDYWGPIVFYLGTGHFISDFKDFLHFRILGSDEVSTKTFWRKFWGID